MDQMKRKPYQGQRPTRDAIQRHVRRWHAGLHQTLSDREVQYGIASAVRGSRASFASAGEPTNQQSETIHRGRSMATVLTQRVEPTRKLEACPFCDGEEIELMYYRIEGFPDMAPIYKVDCMGCGAAGPVRDNPSSATESWNYAMERILLRRQVAQKMKGDLEPQVTVSPQSRSG